MEIQEETVNKDVQISRTVLRAELVQIFCKHCDIATLSCSHSVANLICIFNAIV